MSTNIITEKKILDFQNHLRENEKASLTIEKYVHAVRELMEYLKGTPLSKTVLLNFREHLQKNNRAKTVNTKLSAINAYLDYIDLSDIKIKFLKVQRSAFIEEERNLCEAEYHRLLDAAKSKKNRRLYYVMLTICGSGIRVSELRFITAEAVENGKAEIRLKGKTRTVILQKDLCRKLQRYIKEAGVISGPVFCTSSGRPLDRSNIYHDMKKLCEAAKVNPKKVFPHNLRHLFAKSYYAIEKNLAHLADILGHSSVETTRIYVAKDIQEHERTLMKMRLII